jgi:aminoglycoside phosphotransferase (APT) family kinase protein
MKSTQYAPLAEVIHALGAGPHALIGQGGESWVLGLDDQRIARINRPGATREAVESRNGMLAELGTVGDSVPFAIPQVLTTDLIEGYFVTIERRLPGRPLEQLLVESKGEARASLVRAYLEAADKIGDLEIARPWYGDLFDSGSIRTASFGAYLERRATRSLNAAGPLFDQVEPTALVRQLPEPDGAALVHLDAFPGNMLADGQTITAVLDFGFSCVMGDRRYDPLTAAAYLTPEITPGASEADWRVAQEWLVARGLAELFYPVQQWIAAYWSFATDDPGVHQWCRTILLGRDPGGCA